MAQLIAPRIRVTIETAAGDVDHDVQADNRDLIAWDTTRGRRAWPAGTDAPMLWTTFLAWHALKRTGADVPKTFEEFAEICVNVRPIDAAGDVISGADDDVETVSPIPPVPVTG